jgi:hypothetical protein
VAFGPRKCEVLERKRREGQAEERELWVWMKDLYL